MTVAIQEKKFSLGRVAQYGLIIGVAIIYLGFVGVVETFQDRDVIFETLALGRALILLIALGLGYAAAYYLWDNDVPKALIAGVGSGFVGSLMVAGVALLMEPLGMRNMFVNASPALFDIFTFADWQPEGAASATTGIFILIGMLTGFSLLGAVLHIIPTNIRRLLVAGFMSVLIIGTLQELLDVILSRFDATEGLAEFLFGRRGLSLQGVATVFGVAAIFNLTWNLTGSQISNAVSELPTGQRRVGGWVVLGLFSLLLLALPPLVGSYISQILVLVGIYVLMGLGLNIEIGLAGLLDLGFVGFFAIGAYTVAILTSPTEIGLGTITTGEPSSYVSFWVAIPIAVAISGIAGVFLGIPVLRMRGDYLAIVTLGFAEIIRILVLSDFLRPILGGAQGVLSIPKPGVEMFVGILNASPPMVQNFLLIFFNEEGRINDPGHFYYLIVVGCLLVAFVAWRLQNARVGRNWMALREDEDVAEAMGINLIASKLLAFGIGAAFAGLGGAIFAAQLGSVFPHSFGLIVSINVVSLVIVGGSGSIPGVIIGALVLVGLPELLREFAEFRLLIYGALLIVMMLLKPEGFWPSEVARREMANSEDDNPVGAAAPAGSPAK